MKAQIRPDIIKKEEIPVKEKATGIETYITFDGMVASKQLEDEDGYNTEITVNEIVYLANSVDLKFTLELMQL